MRPPIVHVKAVDGWVRRAKGSEKVVAEKKGAQGGVEVVEDILAAFDADAAVAARRLLKV